MKPKRINKVDIFFLCVIGAFMVWLLWSFGGVYLDKLANGENEKYESGDAVYSEEEVHEYFNTHKEELNQIAELITSKCKFREDGQLEVGMSVFRYVEFFNRHKYIVNEYSYSENTSRIEKEIHKYKKDFFTKEEIEVLNHLTDRYCHIISLEPRYFWDESSRKPPYLRFILRSDNFGITQQLVYMPDGSTYYDDAGRIIELGDNWYYHTNR